MAPVKEHVESVARTAAAGLFVSRVLAFADSRPLPALQHYCRSLPGDYSASSISSTRFTRPGSG